MKKFLLIKMILLSFMASGLFALTSQNLSDAGFNNLTTVQQAEILKQVGQLNDQSLMHKINNSNPEEIDQWVNIGSNIGKGLVGAAKELGVQVNEFSETKVGQLTILLIVWNIMGNMIVHFIGGILVWIIGFFSIWFIRKYIAKPSMEDDGRIGLSISTLVVVVAGIIVMFTFK